MSKIFITNANGEKSTIDIDAGLSLMEHLRETGFDEIQAICGGCCSCATCHVHIEAGLDNLPPIEQDEESLLEFEDSYDVKKSRLSCQFELDDSHDGLEISLLEDSF